MTRKEIAKTAALGASISAVICIILKYIFHWCLKQDVSWATVGITTILSMIVNCAWLIYKGKSINDKTDSH